MLAVVICVMAVGGALIEQVQRNRELHRLELQRRVVAVAPGGPER